MDRSVGLSSKKSGPSSICPAKLRAPREAPTAGPFFCARWLGPGWGRGAGGGIFRRACRSRAGSSRGRWWFLGCNLRVPWSRRRGSRRRRWSRWGSGFEVNPSKFLPGLPGSWRICLRLFLPLSLFFGFLLKSKPILRTCILFKPLPRFPWIACSCQLTNKNNINHHLFHH